MKKVLFVCTQNVFRSLSAHHLMKKYLEENNLQGYEIDSAGTVAHPFESPYSWTIDRLNQYGIVIEDYKNKKLSQTFIDKFDIIICMTKKHKQFVEENFDKKAYLFNEIAYSKQDDLMDDVEFAFDTSLSEFVVGVVDYIKKSIPNLVKNLENY